MSEFLWSCGTVHLTGSLVLVMLFLRSLALWHSFWTESFCRDCLLKSSTLHRRIVDLTVLLREVLGGFWANTPTQVWPFWVAFFPWINWIWMKIHSYSVLYFKISIYTRKLHVVSRYIVVEPTKTNRFVVGTAESKCFDEIRRLSRSQASLLRRLMMIMQVHCSQYKIVNLLTAKPRGTKEKRTVYDRTSVYWCTAVKIKWHLHTIVLSLSLT